MPVTELSSSDAPLPPRLLTLKQGAAYVGVSYWTLRDLVLNGTLPAVRAPSGRINSGRNHGQKQQTRVLVPSTDPRVRSLRKVLVDRVDLDRLIAEWKGST
jgi:predicted site-specific integrase-resolvase